MLSFLHELIESFPRRPLLTSRLRTRAGISLSDRVDQSTLGDEREGAGVVTWSMASVEEHLRELLKLPVEDRAHAAKILLDSLGDAPAHAHAERTRLEESREGGSGPSGSEEDLEELEELASDKEGLRAAVRAAVEAELDPLHELTGLLGRIAELARTTGHALHSRTA